MYILGIFAFNVSLFSYLSKSIRSYVSFLDQNKFAI